MSVDENIFFREATLRICSSLNIVEALKSCFDYVKLHIPMNRMYLHIYDADLNLTRIVASARDDMVEEPERILSLPEKGRNERAAELNADLLKNEDVIRVWNRPDPAAGIPEILERLGLNAETSLMNMLLRLVKGKQIGSLMVFADGLNRYTDEHTRLLKLLHRPFAIAISNAIELRGHLLFLQNMDRINRALQGTNDLEQMVNDILDAMLSIFDSDRAYLFYPCDPDAPYFEIAMERSRPEYSVRRDVIATALDISKHFRLYLAATGAVTLGPGCDYTLETSRFGEKSKIVMALHPKTGKPWALGMHQCSYPRVWTPDEKRLMEEIARRMTDVLTSLLAHRDLHESEQRHRAILQMAMDGFFRADMQGQILEVNETYCRMSGYSEQELLTMNIADVEALHTAEMIASNIRRFAEEGPNRFESVHRRKDGSLFDVEISAQYQPIVAGQTVVFVRDITERKRAEEASHFNELRLHALLKLNQMTEHPVDTITDFALEKAVELTKSKIGYLALMNDDESVLTVHSWSKTEMEQSRGEGALGAYLMAETDLWGEAVRQRRPVVTNDYASPNPCKKGCPPGHAELARRLHIPVFEGERIVAVAGVGNKETDYDESDVRQLTLLMVGMWRLLQRKQTEDRLRHATGALRRSETYLAEAQRLSHTGSWAFDLASNKYIYASNECSRIFELDTQEGLPNREAVSRLIHREDWGRVNADFEKSLREKVDTSSEFRLVLPSGTVKHVQVIRHPVLNEAGDVVELVGTTIDITQRKRAEEALRQSEAYLAEAERLSHTGSWAFDLASNKYVYFSEECFRIFELDAQEGSPTREAISRLIHPEDWDRVNGDFEKSVREKVDTSTGFRVTLPSGTAKHIQVIRHPVLNDAGDVVRIVGTAIDTTERKKAEAEINSLKNYLSSIIDCMPSMLIGMDTARTVTQWNRQAEAFTRIPAGEAMGKPIADLLPDFAPWIMSMGTDTDKHNPSSMENLLIEKEGQRRFYDLMLYLLLVDHVEGSVLRIEDVTERARIQELMVQTEKMMSIGGLAAGMAHEINNPLGIITQAAHNIERRISLDLHANRKVSEELGLNLEGIRAYFDKRQISDAIASIRTASSRAARIVANMLQFSRRPGTAMERTSLAQIIDQALELAASDYDLKKKYDFRSIEIIKDYQDTPQVSMVSVEIEQVILNLLKNAAQAMIANPPDRRPSITFRLRCDGKYAVIEVEDNGPGMTDDIRRRIFEPFFTTKEPRVGTGLGLSVSYMIVTRNHKGLMEVQSTPGSGTVFKVKLPIGGEQT